jgi:hypothetical protein
VSERHFSTWLRRSGIGLPTELESLRPPQDLTYARSLEWWAQRLADAGAADAGGLIAALEPSLLELRDRWSEETGLPAVVHGEFTASDSASPLLGLVFGPRR